MSATVDDRVSELRRIAKQFDDRIKLARASELARDGRLLEAEGILCQGNGLPQSVDELDMLARIYVRQSRHEEAKRHWRAAAKIDGSPAHDECIVELDRWLEHRHKLVLLGVKLVGALIVVIAAILAVVHFGFIHSK